MTRITKIRVTAAGWRPAWIPREDTVTWLQQEHPWPAAHDRASSPGEMHGPDSCPPIAAGSCGGGLPRQRCFRGLLVTLGRREPVAEGDGECVQKCPAGCRRRARLAQVAGAKRWDYQEDHLVLTEELAVSWRSYPMPSRALAFWSRMARAALASIWGSLM